MVVAASLCIANSASAALIQWDVTGSFNTGGAASGTIVWDTVNNRFDSWNIDLTGDEMLSAATYSNTVTNGSQFNFSASLNLLNGTAGRGLLGFIASSDNLFARLANVVSPITFVSITECRPTCANQRTGTTASFVNGKDVTAPPVLPPPTAVVPLPASLTLMVAALGMMGVLRTRRSRLA